MICITKLKKTIAKYGFFCCFLCKIKYNIFIYILTKKNEYTKYY